MSLVFKNVPLHNMDFQWWNPTRIIFGKGKVRDLAEDLSLDWNFDGKTRVMIVTDEGVKKAGILDYLLDSLKGSAIEVAAVFDKTLPEAEKMQIYEITKIAKDADIDFWIALGGGSCMDACKSAALLEANDGKLEDFLGLYMVQNETKPIVCIPTTAGTGSEMSWGAVVMDSEAKQKLVLGDYKFIPKVAVLDPEVTKSLPAHLVAATGLDALTHAIGSLASKDRQDLSAAIAFRTVEMVADNLEEAYLHNSENLDVRSKMLIASCMGGIAFQTALPGADHGIGHTAGALHHIHHGLSVAIANLYVMEFNLKAIPHIYASVATALGVKGDGLSDEARGMKAIEKLRELYGKVGVKCTLKEYGFPTSEEIVEKMIEQSMNDACMAFNPVGISRTPEFEKLIRNCIGI